LEAVDRFGLKAWHLRKFDKAVRRFYQRNVTGREYRSEPELPADRHPHVTRWHNPHGWMGSG
jgi:hypothetical protein